MDVRDELAGRFAAVAYAEMLSRTRTIGDVEMLDEKFLVDLCEGAYRMADRMLKAKETTRSAVKDDG